MGSVSVLYPTPSQFDTPRLKIHDNVLNSYCETSVSYWCNLFWMHWNDQLNTWDHAVENKARIQEVHVSLKTFDFLFGTFLGEMVLQHRQLHWLFLNWGGGGEHQ